ncbi:MAG: hypothetical protein EZS28_040401 [Streblomastix strix]|uniref:Uncharacterized protein n=1 Tax=Streblomastix strix TaxID=222440 RepID=A0A5J4U1E2_9EUKA|nr:MAG: hypothetical protein EZS28_040401 [Streblomastix strix]
MIFFVWVKRHREHFQQNPAKFILLFQTENWKQADQRYISTRHERLVQTLKVQNETANSIKHAYSTELAIQGFDARTITVFTHHISDLKIDKEYYIFAVIREQDSIGSALVKNHGKKQATQIISKQTGGARVSEVDVVQQSPLGYELFLSPQKNLASPLSLPSFRPNPSLKLSLLLITRVQISRNHKYRRMIKTWNHKKKLKIQIRQ